MSTDSVEGTVATARPIALSRAPIASTCEPHRELIVDRVRRGQNALVMWHELVDAHGIAERYASVRRFVGRPRGAATPAPSGIITTAPGEEAQG